MSEMATKYNPGKTHKDVLEALIDLNGLTAVVDLICEICYEKAEHIRVNFSDEATAGSWDAAGASLVNPKIEVKFPS